MPDQKGSNIKQSKSPVLAPAVKGVSRVRGTGQRQTARVSELCRGAEPLWVFL